MTTIPDLAEMEQAWRRNDPAYDGVFFLAVRTTGIFCKPSCPTRKALRKNIEFYHSAREAIFAGYRPCKRCRPLESNGKAPQWVERLLTTIDADPARKYSDAYLRSAGIEPARARRFFLKNYGMTFQAYCRGRRLGKSFEQIRLGKDLDDVALGYGYNSHSGFRDAFAKTSGTSPGRSRDADCVLATWIESPMGPLIAAATSEGICLLEFTERRMLEAQFASLRRHFKSAVVPGENEHIKLLKEELKQYFEGTLKTFSVKLIYPATPFQQKVWNELIKIPFGKTVSYEDIARRIGSLKACRAVGTANGLNRIAIVIPCHRVVNKNGELGGYGGGLWRKRKLLDLEQGGSLFN
ncbi:MAG TPA: methylated-DNA--[protein]-cysteine S-methyltransferase [Bacteroidota bacterium]|jgi:AraC family transcriptional regulator of adaptative response/methylated-DNA-[protein]-cysteine methyltransferase|nr:methylated-DNA--[protein]-cysteine S-methyltransferase [Bacteroidota bacterium]